MESNFKPRLLVAYFFRCIGSAFGVGVVVTQVVAVAAVWLLMLHIGYYLRSASLRCVYRRCRCRPPVSQPAACAYLAESGPRRGLSDGMMLTQNQFHWQYMDDAADAAAPLILLLSLYSVFFFSVFGVFRCLFWWMVDKRQSADCRFICLVWFEHTDAQHTSLSLSNRVNITELSNYRDRRVQMFDQLGNSIKAIFMSHTEGATRSPNRHLIGLFRCRKGWLRIKSN